MVSGKTRNGPAGNFLRFGSLQPAIASNFQAPDDAPGTCMTRDEIRLAIERTLTPDCFLVRGGRLAVEHRPREETAWEVFRGHLLDQRQTRQQREFEAWDITLHPAGDGPPQPLLSVKIDAAEGRLYVTRAILVFGWEAYEAEPNVIESRSTQVWIRELVGTLRLDRFSRVVDLQRQLAKCLLLAVSGASRLPITSIESPLPAFAVGQLAYFPWLANRDNSGGGAKAPLANAQELIEEALSPHVTVFGRSQVLETVLRTSSPEEAPQLAGAFLERWRANGWPDSDLAPVWRGFFNHLALTPHTVLAANVPAWLERLAYDERLGPSPAIDVTGYMLRHLVRHLTAFDLETFHNQGSDYPDALLLDGLLKLYLRLIERYPGCFEDKGGRAQERELRYRRRALRQGWLLRKLHEGLPVPDAPTSPGDNQRVLPAPWTHVPDEQLSQKARRRKWLFASDPTEHLAGTNARRVLEQSFADLGAAAELRELGMAVYLDRPLGIERPPGEMDRTPLLSYEAFSGAVAAGRLVKLRQFGCIQADCYEAWLDRLDAIAPSGLPARQFDGTPRPGAAALEDALRIANDFAFVRTTRQSLNEFLEGYDWQALQERSPDTHRWLAQSPHVLLIRRPNRNPIGIQRPIGNEGPFGIWGPNGIHGPTGVSLLAYDEGLQPRLELGVGSGAGEPVQYVEEAGREYALCGLQLLTIWEAATQENGAAAGEWRECRIDDVWLAPSFRLSRL